MRKVIFIFLLVISFCFSAVDISANTINYDNVITDYTTIEEDFEVLNMDISNYYMLDETIQKTYVVGYSEAIVEEDYIQSYIYVYRSYKIDNADSIYFGNISYSINNKEYALDSSYELHCIGGYLYKLKGFKYSYIKNVDIKITVDNLVAVFQEDSYPYEKEYEANCNEFEVSISHSQLSDNAPFEMEIDFDSVLIIDEMQLVRVNVQPELWESCSFAGWWNTFWDYDNKALYLHFYNFNFPDNIEVDSIEYAKFEYDYVYYQHNILYGLTGELIKNDKKEKTRETKIKEYTPGTHNFDTANQSGELEFETFTLGNRITKGEFPEYVSFSEEEKKLFDYDCSILLDSSVSKAHGVPTDYVMYYYQLEYVDFLELHYMNDGILYKCQVITTDVGTPDNPEIPVDGDDPSEENNPWDLFLKWFMDNFPNSLYLIIGIGIVVLVAIGLIIAFAGPLVGNAIVYFFKLILKGIVWILLLPINLIKLIFGK